MDLSTYIKHFLFKPTFYECLLHPKNIYWYMIARYIYNYTRTFLVTSSLFVDAQLLYKHVVNYPFRLSTS